MILIFKICCQKDEDGEGAKGVQTAFTVKITKFDDAKKVALIKEIKNVVEGLNLVQVCIYSLSFGQCSI